MPGAWRRLCGMFSDSTADRSAPRSNGASRLGLGTVQFGVDYGITNAAGRVAVDEARAIMKAAASCGIDLIDTAALYGDSETVIGAAPEARSFAIVTKTAKVADAASPDAAADSVERRFVQSLENLKGERVQGLLIHDAADLLGPFGDAVWRRMDEIRRSGRAEKIGVSVYDGTEIDRILQHYDPDIVQLPINAVDGRLDEGGQLDALARRGVEVHARSIFLQGLLLQKPEDIPARFGPLRDAVAGLRAIFAEAGLGLIEGLIAGALSHPAISRAIVGTTSRRELLEIAAAASGATLERADLGAWRITDPRVLNPAMWAAL